ncbi:GntR family transcriptional regulator [Mycolicibacterium sp. CH28]|uniref:GntR family transcriptional regulator n=1 Tax=Mycolicibacterium sp. CH28 TaxID=2512237 RepID=UPI00138723E0|nr:GntR family transcriptional regulator [Mycolicibacterium sp. CH28]
MQRASFHSILRSDLLAGRFSPEQPLSESALTGVYGVSRTPVREALNRLEQEGLIVRAARGYRIRSGAPDDVIEIYDVRIVLEQAAAEAAATRRTDLELAQLTQLHRQAYRQDDPATARKLHSHWHEVLWVASHNSTLCETLTNLVARLRIYDRGAQHHEDPAVVAEEHRVVMSAIEVGDGAAAGQAIAAHLQRSKQLRLEAFAQSGLAIL